MAESIPSLIIAGLLIIADYVVYVRMHTELLSYVHAPTLVHAFMGMTEV
jgi:hypothetical protein